MRRYDSPLRYPGGKTSLAPFLAKTIELNGLSGCSYFEPFAGGAGAALRLLRQGIVSNIHLNDLDPCIHAFWRSVLNEPERFADRIRSVPLDIAEWEKQRQICRQADSGKRFELGFSAFYLNRCNRSGILFGAAPIGGRKQAGKWKIEVRFNRESLAKRVLEIARRRKQIHVANMDAQEFLVKHLPRGRGRKSIFVYLDPPYYSNGKRLYMNFYSDCDHKKLADYMRRQNALNWVMSYDDAPFIEGLYATSMASRRSLQYSLQRKQRARELLIAPAHVRIPPLEAQECIIPLT